MGLTQEMLQAEPKVYTVECWYMERGDSLSDSWDCRTLKEALRQYSLCGAFHGSVYSKSIWYKKLDGGRVELQSSDWE